MSLRSPGVIVFALLLAALLGVPAVMRSAPAEAPEGVETLVIITPHNEQIRAEFGRAFDEWRREKSGKGAFIDWRRLGGTTETRRLLESIYIKALREERIAPDGSCPPGTMPYDLLFGGGSYEHNLVKRGVPGVEKNADGSPKLVPMSAPFDFSESALEGWFGAENRIGSEKLYDPDLHWIGAAVSGFGIGYNRPALAELGLPEPRQWKDLADHRYTGRLALADPRQSGSVATAYDSILSKHGWDEGWKLLRAMCANARSFNASSAKAVLDISSGDAAAGICIDFYGRFESQAVRLPGQSAAESRVGYVDPAGEVYIDPDPISLMRGAPSPGLAHEFVEFVMSPEGQALWQLPARGDEPGLGPRDYELRRLPSRRDMYDSAVFERFIDPVNPFEIASDTASKGWRSLIGPMFGAFSIDMHEDQVRAWEAIGRARDAGDPRAAEMERLFFAWPTHVLPDGTELEFTEANYGKIRSDWRDPKRAAELRIAYMRFFRERYRMVEEMGRGSR